MNGTVWALSDFDTNNISNSGLHRYLEYNYYKSVGWTLSYVMRLHRLYFTVIASAAL